MLSSQSNGSKLISIYYFSHIDDYRFSGDAKEARALGPDAFDVYPDDMKREAEGFITSLISAAIDQLSIGDRSVRHNKDETVNKVKKKDACKIAMADIREGRDYLPKEEIPK